MLVMCLNIFFNYKVPYPVQLEYAVQCAIVVAFVRNCSNSSVKICRKVIFCVGKIYITQLLGCQLGAFSASFAIFAAFDTILLMELHCILRPKRTPNTRFQGLSFLRIREI